MHPRSLLRAAPSELPRGREEAFLAKGFRPFFLLAAAFAAFAMPLWVFAIRGDVTLGAYFGGTYWHAHEMFFGFCVAVIAGFLLTAVENWTHRETAVGAPLGLLAGLWLAGRVAVLLADRLPRTLPALVDLAFLPALAFACARPMLASSNRRNYPFVGMLAVLFAANLGMHLGALGVAPEWTRRGALLAAQVVVLMILVVTARVVPMFTRNATGESDVRNAPWLDRASLVGMLALAVLDALELDARLGACAAAVTSLLVFARSASWGAEFSLRHPLLWILHAGHAFVGVGLALRVASHFVPQLSPSTALHALTAGSMGCLTLGMMARVSLGHTGRPLEAPRSVHVAFVFMVLAGVARVAGPLFGPAAYLLSLMAAGTLFALAFALYLAAYAPMLFAPRADGRPG